jgi:glycosyltransferase involved in cell wall biosynthesis
MTAGRGPASPLTVSVVMPTRARSELVERSLTAALNDPATSEAVVVLDPSGESGRSAAIVDRLTALDRRVHIVRAVSRAPGRRGQAARDEGAHAARGEVIVAIDDDVVARPGTISAHARHHRGDNRLAVVGYMPVLLPASGRFGQPAARYYRSSYERECSRFRRDPDSILERLWGGNLSVRRADWLAAAERSQGCGGYHDDRAFGLALRELGLRGIFDAGLRADHWYSRSITQFVRDARDSGAGEAAIGPALATPSSSGGRGPAGLLRWAARSRATWAVSVSAGGALALGAAAVGFERVEDYAARALWLLGRERGYLEAHPESSGR